jgi:intracellular septation protein A
MHISIDVPYSEALLRRTLQVLARRQMRLFRISGAVLVLAGVALIALDTSMFMGYVVAVLGVVFALAMQPLVINSSMRMQSSVIKDGFHVTLDDEWATVTFPLAQSRFRWAGFDRVVETPEVWYLMFGKIQAFVVPKDRMSDEQRAQFATFVSGLRLMGARPSPS